MASGQNIGSLFWTSGIDTSGLKRDSKKASGALSGLFNPAMLGAAAVGAALLKVGSAALDFSRDFETAFAEVQTISEEARNSADSMKESILEMTTEIPVGAVEATKALYQIVSAGYAGADAMTVLEISAKAATAGSSTTAVAADTLTTIMNSYGISADDAMKTSDMLFKTVEMGKTTLNEIGASFSQVASLAASYGVGLDESLAATAALTKLGTPTAESMTQMKAAIIAVTKSLGENIFKTMSFGDALSLARKKADESGEGMQKYFGSVEAVNFILKTTGENAKGYAESLDGINDSGAATNDALLIMNDTLKSQETLFKNNSVKFLSQFGDTLNHLKRDVLPTLNREMKVLADDSIPGYAKALAVLANTVNIPALFGGKVFTAEQFSPEIVQMRKEAERQTKTFKKNSSKLSDEEFEKEIELLKQVKKISDESLANMLDRKEKGYQFDEDKLKIKQQQTLNYYHILEDAEKRLALIKEKKAKPDADAKAEKEKAKAAYDALGIKAKLDKDFKETEAAYDAASGKEMDRLAVKLVALEQEKAAWKEVHEAQLEATRDAAYFDKPMEGMETISVPHGEIENLKKASLELKKIEKIQKRLKGEASDLEGDSDSDSDSTLADGFKEAGKALGELSWMVSDFDEELANTIGLVADLAFGIGEIVAGVAAEDAEMIVGGILEVVKALIDEIAWGSNEYELSLRRINRLLEIQRKLIADASREGGEKQRREEEIALLEKKLKLDKEELAVLQETLDDSWGWEWTKAWHRKNQAVIDHTALVEEDELAIKEANQAYDDFLAGSVTQNTIADVIAQGFMDGKTSVDDFAEYMNDVLFNALLNIFKADLLGGPLFQDWYDYIQKALENGAITSEEKAEIDRRGMLVRDKWEPTWDAMTSWNDSPGSDAQNQNNAAGSIKREITEETGGLLLGRFTAMQIDLAQANEILDTSEGHLSKIVENTAFNKHIPDVLEELQTMNTNLQKVIG